MLTISESAPGSSEPRCGPTRECPAPCAVHEYAPLAFVNIAFALMIFFRNLIFTYFDKRLLTHRAVIPYRSGVDCGYYHFGHFSDYCPHAATGAGTIYVEYHHRLLLALSLCWSLSNYCFIFSDLALCRPLLVILMTTGLTALYHHWPGITAFMLPLWVTGLAGGNTAPLSHRDPLFDPLGHFYRDFAVWPTYLQRWYDEAGYPPENMQLIQRLEYRQPGCLNRNR